MLETSVTLTNSELVNEWQGRPLKQPHHRVEVTFTTLVEMTDPHVPLKFGKHKGIALKDVPSYYLEWMIRVYAQDGARFALELRRREVTQKVFGQPKGLDGEIVA